MTPLHPPPAQQPNTGPIEQTRRVAWGITGSGHYLRECLQQIHAHDDVDVFLSKAGAEVLHMYGYDLETLRQRKRVFRDSSASAPPVGLFYKGQYRALVIAPASSNTVAKLVWGISDTLVSNIFAQAGKCRIPTIVFACDTEPVLESEAPRGRVMVYPRRIDLDNVERLRQFEATKVVTSLTELEQALKTHRLCRNTSYS